VSWRPLTPRRLNIGLTLLFFVVLPPLTARAMPKWFTGTTALVLAGAVAVTVAAISLNLLLGYAGQISLGHAALLGVGAFTSGVLTTKYGLPMYLGIPAGAITAALIAFLVGLPALRLRGLYLAMVTIAFGYTMQQSVFRTNYLSGGSAGIGLPRRVSTGIVLTNNADFLAVALVFLVGIWLIDVNVVRTKLGRAFKAIRENEAVAQSFGIDVTRYKLTAFVLSGAMAGIAGALYGHAIGFVNNETFGLDRSLLLVIIVVVGGLASRPAVVAAALSFWIFPNLIQGLRGWQFVVGAALLIYTVARHPGGFAQAFREARERAEGRRVSTDEIEDEGVLPKLPSLPRPAGLPPRPAADAALVLEATDVSVRFGGLQALDRASIAVPRGKIVGLIGPNGAGKSTLFNAVSGLVRMQSGRVRFLGEDVTALRPDERARLGIARSFQDIGLAKQLTVFENFLLAQHQVASYGSGAALGYGRRVARVETELSERAVAAVEALGFERFLGSPVRTLSHGQQRIVEIGCMLVTAPELVMLDEPSAGMSPGAAENLAVRLADLRDELGRTVLLIEHNVPLVLDVCDEVYVLDHGELLAHGLPAEIAQHPDVVGAYLGATSIGAGT
jgi:ABC-type branched-subunit amino acid transport system ATPase component/ABC-type branched-subunit amino acid transport system permease subunit